MLQITFFNQIFLIVNDYVFSKIKVRMIALANYHINLRSTALFEETTH